MTPPGPPVDRTRVLHVVPDLRVGGAERHVTALMPGLDRNQYAASVVCIGEPGALFADLRAAGVPATALRRSRRQAVSALIDLVRLMRRDAPDVVLTRGYNADMLGRAAAIIARVPHRVVWIHHHADADDRPRLRRVVDRLLERHTSAYFGVAQAQRPFLVDVLGFPEDKVRIIHNGVDAAGFDTRADRAVLTGSALEASGPIVGTVSAMRPEKDHPTFLRAAAAVRSDHPSAGFLVVGDGPERGRAQTLADDLGLAERTVFAGSRDDIPAVLSAMDVFVLSSRAVECFPMALLEAMASGVPAVCTDVGGVGEMVDDGVTGFLVPPQDPSALAVRVGQILADEDLARSMGAAARDRVVREFGLDVMVRRTEAALDEITGRNGTPAAPVRLSVVMDLTFVGGAEMLLLGLFGVMDRTVVTPRVLCLREEGPLAGELRAAGVEVEVLPPASSRDPRRVTDLARALRLSETDVVLVAHHHRAALALGRAAALLAGVPSIVAAHDMDLTSVGRRVLPRSAVQTLRASSALILLSQAQGRYLRSEEGVGRRPWSRTREVVIPNGIAIPSAPTPADRVIARHRLGIAPSEVAIGIVARLSAQKAHEVLFAAFEKCLAAREECVLVVIGTGDREAELRELAADRGIAHRVRFLGVRRDVPELLAGLDVSCLSSVHEGVPMILIESMAAGVPVVATDCGSITDVITDGDEGFVVGVGDDEAFADRLTTLAADPALRRRMGTAGREAAQDRFDIAHTARGYQELLTSVVGRRRAGRRRVRPARVNPSARKPI